MRSSLTYSAVAALAFVVAGIPIVNALDVGCVRVNEVTTLPGGTSTLFTPPGADVLGWTPECVVVANGSTITFHQVDGINHGVVTDCFNLGLMDGVRVRETTLKLDYDHRYNVLFTEENGELSGCESLGKRVGDTLLIDYWCIFHGKQMPGRIVLEL